MALRFIIYGFLLISLLGTGPAPKAANPGPPQASSPLVTLLPLANFSADPTSSGIITPLINQQLSQLGFTIADSAEVWDILRKYRIRAAYGISLEEMRRLGAAMKITYIALGSIDIYNEGNRPEFGISLRLVRVEDGTIVWADSHGATGNDYIAVLGLHRIDSIVTLAQRVLSDMFEDVNPQAFSSQSYNSTGPAVAVIDFNSPEPGTFGGAIISTHVLNRLLARGFRVIEPGILRAIYRRLERFPRGEIDLELLRALNDSLRVTYALTGSVDVFDNAIAGAENSYPRIVMGARLLEASSGRILKTCELAVDGHRMNIFGTGNVHAMEQIAADAANEAIEKLELEKLQGL